jgi:hypothetical protein
MDNRAYVVLRLIDFAEENWAAFLQRVQEGSDITEEEIEAVFEALIRQEHDI